MSAPTDHAATDATRRVDVTTHELRFGGGILRRGFWLYVWQIGQVGERDRFYVGRTGDSSSMNAQSPFNRMGAHLGWNNRSNVLRRRLTSLGIDPSMCDLRLVAYGPVADEAASDAEHRHTRDVVAALEKALENAMRTAGYEVINTVHCRKPLDHERFARVRAAFAGHFPRLAQKEKS